MYLRPSWAGMLMNTSMELAPEVSSTRTLARNWSSGYTSVTSFTPVSASNSFRCGSIAPCQGCLLSITRSCDPLACCQLNCCWASAGEAAVRTMAIPTSQSLRVTIIPCPLWLSRSRRRCRADRLHVLTIVAARMSIRGRAPDASALELGHHQVRAADAPAQLAPQIGEQGDGDGGMIAPEGVERLLGEDVAHDVLVGDDGGGAGLPIEQGDLSEHSARRERGEPALPSLTGQVDPGARRPAQHEEQVALGAALRDHDLARTEGAPLEARPHHCAVGLAQPFQHAQPIQVHLVGEGVSLRARLDHAILGPLEGGIRVPELAGLGEGSHHAEILKDAPDKVAIAGMTQEEMTALLPEPLVDLEKNARARAVELVHPLEIEDHVARARLGRSLHPT